MKKIFSFFILMNSISAYAYENEFYDKIKNSDNNKILIDVISYDYKNADRHFNFAKKITADFPNKTFRFGFHKNATFNGLKNDEFKKYKSLYSSENSKYNIDFAKNDFSLISNLNNGKLYVCKAAAAKRQIDIQDFNELFNLRYTSYELNVKSRRDGFLILKEKNTL